MHNASGVTNKETSRRVRREGVNKWPNDMTRRRKRRGISKVTTGRDLTIRPYLTQSNMSSEVDMQTAPSTQAATDSCFPFHCYKAVSRKAPGSLVALNMPQGKLSLFVFRHEGRRCIELLGAVWRSIWLHRTAFCFCRLQHTWLRFIGDCWKDTARTTVVHPEWCDGLSVWLNTRHWLQIASSSLPEFIIGI